MPSATSETRTAVRPTTSRTPHSELALFHRTLAELCRAEVPLPRAFRILQKDLENSRLRHEVAEMADEVERGVPLLEAYSSRKDRFPELYCALVEAGMATSDLPGVLDEIAAHAATEAEVENRIGRSLRYPVYAGALILTLGTMVLFLMPQMLAPLAADTSPFLRPKAPGDASSYTYLSYLPWIGICLLVTAVLGVLAFAAFRRPVDGAAPGGLLFRLPMVGRLRTYATRASLTATLALLARRQLPLPQMLRLALSTAAGTKTRQQFEQMLARAQEGGSLSGSLAAGQVIPPSLLFLVQAAEKTGTVADALAEISRIYRQRLERAVDRFCVLIRPTVEILLGLVVLCFVLACAFPGLHFINNILNPW